jgi:hypothetical protein
MLKCGKEVSNSIYKKIVYLTILTGSILLLPSISFAQGGDLPCGGDDPTTSNPCPLDTWVWMLAVVAVILGAIYLQRKQKLQMQG